jgi:hypothetical protein
MTNVTLKKQSEPMKPYYYVYRWNNSAPRVRHATLESAQAEAMRLAEQHPTGYFEILKCVGFARTTKAATFWMDGEEPESFSRNEAKQKAYNATAHANHYPPF